MAGTQIQRRRGTTAEHAAFTGASGELTVDTTKKTVVVHDGLMAGGFPLVKEADKAVPNGVASLDGTGKVPSIQLPGTLANGFVANKNGVSQAIAAGTPTKVTFTTEVFDKHAEYDAPNSRYTPTRAGVYLVGGGIYSTTGGIQIQFRLYKNGAQVANLGAIVELGFSGCALVEANGTTDYFEVYTYFGAAGTIEGAIGTTAFFGIYMGPA